jgi:MFS family permease
MDINAQLFVLALLLLWFPRQWMRFGPQLARRRRRSSSRPQEPWVHRETGDPRVNFREEFAKFRNYIDLLRAAAGSLALLGGLGIEPAIVAAEEGGRGNLKVMAIRIGVLLIGVLVQTIRYEHRRVSYYPPVFFLAGVSVGLCGIRAAGFAFVLAWTLGSAVPSALGFLSGYAVLMVAFGTLFPQVGRLPVIASGVLAFVPVLLSLMTRRPLTILTRKASRTARI